MALKLKLPVNLARERGIQWRKDSRSSRWRSMEKNHSVMLLTRHFNVMNFWRWWCSTRCSCHQLHRQSSCHPFLLFFGKPPLKKSFCLKKSFQIIQRITERSGKEVPSTAVEVFYSPHRLFSSSALKCFVLENKLFFFFIESASQIPVRLRAATLHSFVTWSTEFWENKSW